MYSLIATRRSRRKSSAAYTTPKPPSPSTRSITNSRNWYPRGRQPWFACPPAAGEETADVSEGAALIVETRLRHRSRGPGALREPYAATQGLDSEFAASDRMNVRAADEPSRSWRVREHVGNAVLEGCLHAVVSRIFDRRGCASAP